MENEDKKYKITKVQKMDMEIYNARRNSIMQATLSGLCALGTTNLCINAINTNNLTSIALGGIIGALTIYKMINYVDVRKQIYDLEKKRAELIEIENNEEEMKRNL